MLQIATGRGFAQASLAHHVINRKAALFFAGKQALHQRQRFFFNAFTAAIGSVVFSLQLIQRIHVLLVDDFPFALLIVELHEPFKGLAQALP